MSREGFIIYKSFYAPIENLSDEDKGKLFDALFKFQLFGQEPEKTSPIIPYFLFFKNQFRLDDEKYQKTIERNRGNGSKGGRPKTKANPENPVGYLEPKKADKEKEKEKEKDKKKVFIPPAVEEVKSYFIENGYPSELGEKAFNYYAVANWKDSKGNAVKNWKQKVMAVWFKEENKVKPKSRIVV